MNNSKVKKNYAYFIFFSFVFIISILLTFPFFLILKISPRKYKTTFAYFIARVFLRVIFIITWIKIRRYYLLKMDKSKQYIFIANHYSYLDPLVCIHGIPVIFRPLAKSEMNRIPIFGQIYSTISIGVKRSSLKSQKKSFDRMLKTIQGDFSILVYPEGTFNEDDSLHLLPFKSGAFRIAMGDTSNNIEIVPIVIEETQNRLHYSSIFSLNPGEIRMFFLDTINPRDYSSIPELKQVCFTKMHDFMKERKDSFYTNHRHLSKQ